MYAFLYWGFILHNNLLYFIHWQLLVIKIAEFIHASFLLHSLSLIILHKQVDQIILFLGLVLFLVCFAFGLGLPRHDVQ